MIAHFRCTTPFVSVCLGAHLELLVFRLGSLEKPPADLPLSGSSRFPLPHSHENTSPSLLLFLTLPEELSKPPFSLSLPRSRRTLCTTRIARRPFTTPPGVFFLLARPSSLPYPFLQFPRVLFLFWIFLL